MDQGLVEGLEQMTLPADGRRETMEDLATESDDDYDNVFTVSSDVSEALDVDGGVLIPPALQMDQTEDGVHHLPTSRSTSSDLSDYQINLNTDGDDASAGSESLAAVDEAFEDDASSSESESHDNGSGDDANNDLSDKDLFGNDLSDNLGAVQEVINQSFTPAALQDFINEAIPDNIKPALHAPSFPGWFLRQELDWHGPSPRLCCARQSADKEDPFGADTIVLRKEDGRNVPLGPGRNGAMLYLSSEKDRPRFENAPVFVELEDQAFVYTGHYDVESELKAKSTVDDPSTQQVVNALAASIDAGPLGERLQWIFLRCKTYNLEYLERLRKTYERRNAFNNTSPTQDTRGVDMKPEGDEQASYETDMQEAIAASLADEASRAEWSRWGMRPPHEWRVRWDGKYGDEAPATSR